MIALSALMLAVETVPATPSTAGDFTWLFVKMMLFLGIVTIIAVIILKYAVPKIGFMRRFQQGSYFRVHGRYQLEPRKAVYLIEVCNRYLVIGSGDHAINFIAELSAKDVLSTCEDGPGKIKDDNKA